MAQQTVPCERCVRGFIWRTGTMAILAAIAIPALMDLGGAGDRLALWAWPPVVVVLGLFWWISNRYKTSGRCPHTT